MKKTSFSSNFTTVKVNVFQIVIQTMNICCSFVAFRKNYGYNNPLILLQQFLVKLEFVKDAVMKSQKKMFTFADNPHRS